MGYFSRKLTSILLILTLIITTVPLCVTTASAQVSYNLGDINLDGNISVSDATILQKYLARLTGFNDTNTYLADVDGNSGLSITDVTCIQMHLAKYEREYPFNKDKAKINDKIIFTNGKPEVYTKNKIYGITYNTSDTSTICTRIEDAKGLENDFVIASQFQNGGKNDFDKVYPWSDIRRCNLTVNSDGTKKVTYEGEKDFATDGSNGDVMVEIPKFYSSRTVENGIEKWAITGEARDGFTVEPAFVDNSGKELDSIYVGAYEFTGRISDKNHSVSKQPVTTLLKMEHYRKYAKSSNMTCIDYATTHALQLLYVIEFADKDTDKYMQGYSEVSFFGSSNSPITAISDDRMTITIGRDGERTKTLRAGQTVLITQNTATKQSNLVIEEIDISLDKKTANITFDVPVSDSISDITCGNYFVAGQGQPTGTCDNLNYHTGRPKAENSLSTFRYRYMENIWGNVWAMVEGIRMKNLRYYYTFDTEKYDDETIENWIPTSFVAPNQPYLGDDGHNRAWISEMGYDSENPLLILPTAVTINGSTDKYFSSALYTHYDFDKYGTPLVPDAEYVCTYGGGYDHHTLCGPFTMRFWFSTGSEAGTLHSSRLVCRK